MGLKISKICCLRNTWDEVVNLSDVNASLKAFLDIFLYFFNITFPYKRVKL
jgi:hypothetical protein